jgi:hypothetical protein
VKSIFLDKMSLFLLVLDYVANTVMLGVIGSDLAGAPG